MKNQEPIRQLADKNQRWRFPLDNWCKINTAGFSTQGSALILKFLPLSPLGSSASPKTDFNEGGEKN